MKFDTVENTINSFESLEYRITGGKANYYFSEELHYFIKDDFEVELTDLDEISDNFLHCLSNEGSQYYVVLTFELLEINYRVRFYAFII